MAPGVLAGLIDFDIDFILFPLGLGSGRIGSGKSRRDHERGYPASGFSQKVPSVHFSSSSKDRVGLIILSFFDEEKDISDE